MKSLLSSSQDSSFLHHSLGEIGFFYTISTCTDGSMEEVQMLSRSLSDSHISLGFPFN